MAKEKVLSFTTSKDIIHKVNIDGHIYHFNSTRVDCLFRLIAEINKLKDIDLNGDDQSLESQLDQFDSVCARINEVLGIIFNKEEAAMLIGDYAGTVRYTEIMRIVAALFDEYSSEINDKMNSLSNFDYKPVQ